jgi:3-hydroxyacyl-[acyl-carrier-protein] dehydratase
MSVENAHFRRPVVPGDQMLIKVEKLRSRGLVWKFKGVCEVDGSAVADAVFTAMIAE